MRALGTVMFTNRTAGLKVMIEVIGPLVPDTDLAALRPKQAT
jgi:hypothetical protein